MSEGFPVDESTAIKFAVEFANSQMDRISDVVSSVGKKVTTSLRLHLQNTYKAYLERITKRYGTTKTFFIRDEPTFLYKFYVPLGGRTARNKITIIDAEAIEHIGTRVVIVGTAGSGKSTVMRHLLLDEIARQKRIPVFIECRLFNERKATRGFVLKFIQETLNTYDLKLDDDYVLAAIDAGHFTFLFDGFDEIDPVKRAPARKELLKLCDKYPNNQYVISSRPDPEFAGWPEFSVLETAELTQAQAVSLVHKLPADEDLKRNFAEDLERSLYEKHQTLLSNPLLLTIMILTYNQSASIPQRISLFYHQAYEALYQCHDALKGAFKRRRRTDLDMQEFATVLSCFSIQTYDDRKLRFSRSAALKFLSAAKEVTRAKFDVDDYLTDLQQAVCIVVEDGLELTYAHRSFEEFFVARFICEAKSDIQEQLIAKYAERMRADNVIPLAYEINPECIEQFLLLPFLDRLAKKLKVQKTVGFSHWLRYLKLRFRDFRGTADESLVATLKADDGTEGWALIGIERLIIKDCGDECGWTWQPRLTDKVHEYVTKQCESADNGVYEVDVATLDKTSELAQLLFKGNSAWSGPYVQGLMNARHIIRDKLEKRQSKIANMLGLIR